MSLRSIALILVIGGGVYWYIQNHEKNELSWSFEKQSTSRPVETLRYHCEGKVYCSEMSSCDEAVFYLQNCPGTKMDGDYDGVPCERQWCGGR